MTVLPPTDTARRIAVIGAGPAGLAAATQAAARGVGVDLFEGARSIEQATRRAACL